MHKTIITLLLIISSLCSKGAWAQNIIPQPSEITMGEGFFAIKPNTPVEMNFGGEESRQLKQYIIKTMGLRVFKGNGKGKTPAIRLNLIRVKELPGDARTAGEAYRLYVTPKQITISSHTATGLFYGLQTVRQLTVEENKVLSATINDEPRFPYRGIMLDCSRHFFTVDFIKKQLDLMAYFKINRFHWHLTDGGGWRLEIKKYPRLTQETAYRTQNDWTKWWREHDRRYCHATDSGAYGGFYTQDDAREIVKYAAERNIVVIPEIEMPGHSNEVFSAYPELSCAGKPYSGSDFCAGNDSVFTFLENVLSEVMQIFPSKYIHIGGDEASQEAWKKCPKCQRRMQEQGLNTIHELQADFIIRIEKFLNANGRRLLGWDEIMQGKLAPNAAVMSWTGETAGLKAARKGHHVVMTPGKYCYLDHYQDLPSSQPKAWGGYLPLEKVYSYEPIPQEERGTELEKYVDGVQGNLWTEEVPTPEHAEYMLYPRALAIAEVGWSKNRTPYANFRTRVLNALDKMEAVGYNHFDLRKEIGKRKESLKPCTHAAVGKKVTYLGSYAPKYSGEGDATLTDGKRADWSFKDSRWQGFIGEKGMDVVIDMEQEVDIHEVSADFMQSLQVDIVYPAVVELSVSSDGETFADIYRRETPKDTTRDFFLGNFLWRGDVKARYIRLKATQPKDGGWVFTDEIKVN